ncbi:MAG: hypothetical protein M1837_003532 [Sclerophora amabilis]|nr:MAG: hypothetical protein M1837_003532 [Sclerophora amabilis]
MLLELFVSLYDDYVYHQSLRLRAAYPDHNIRVLAPHLNAIYTISEDTVAAARALYDLGQTMRAEMTDLWGRMCDHPACGAADRNLGTLIDKVDKTREVDCGVKKIEVVKGIAAACGAAAARGGVLSMACRIVREGEVAEAKKGGDAETKLRVGSGSGSVTGPPRKVLREREHTI